jgi:hypothetical protein
VSNIDHNKILVTTSIFTFAIDDGNHKGIQRAPQGSGTA